jgi:hypothetical protein
MQKLDHDDGSMAQVRLKKKGREVASSRPRIFVMPPLIVIPAKAGIQSTEGLGSLRRASRDSNVLGGKAAGRGSDE